MKTPYQQLTPSGTLKPESTCELILRKLPLKGGLWRTSLEICCKIIKNTCDVVI